MSETTEQEIIINREITTEELYDLLQMFWDTELYGPFAMDYRNRLSDEKCIFLPATKRFMVMVYPFEDGIFHKQYKIVLTVVETPLGMEEELKRSFPTNSLTFGIFKIGRLASIEKEKNGQAADKLMEYTQYLKTLLEKAGLLSIESM